MSTPSLWQYDLKEATYYSPYYLNTNTYNRNVWLTDYYGEQLGGRPTYISNSDFNVDGMPGKTVVSNGESSDTSVMTFLTLETPVIRQVDATRSNPNGHSSKTSLRYY